MSTRPKSARVLVCGDNVDDAADVVRALGSEFETVEASTKADAVVADFERFSPDVLVLAFDAIEKSQAYCHGLLRLSKTAHAHPHRTVILCGKDETQLAFELCKKRFFDDYVLYWPQAHDGLRLKMSVWNAACRLAEAQAGGHGDMAAQADSARALETIVDRQLTQGMGHVSTARESIAGAERGAAAVDPRVRRSIETARDGIAPLLDWADGFRAEVAPHVAEMRTRADRVPAARPAVLVVEDDAFAAKLIAKALEQQPFDLEYAANAPAVLTLLRRIKPRVILMDINMPGMDGLALTEFLKASATHASIPVLMLTGDARRETIERSKAVGAAGFIVKPFTRDGLLAKLAPFLR